MTGKIVEGVIGLIFFKIAAPTIIWGFIETIKIFKNVIEVKEE